MRSNSFVSFTPAEFIPRPLDAKQIVRKGAKTQAFPLPGTFMRWASEFMLAPLLLIPPPFASLPPGVFALNAAFMIDGSRGRLESLASVAGCGHPSVGSRGRKLNRDNAMKRSDIPRSGKWGTVAQRHAWGAFGSASVRLGEPHRRSVERLGCRRQAGKETSSLGGKSSPDRAKPFHGDQFQPSLPSSAPVSVTRRIARRWIYSGWGR